MEGSGIEQPNVNADVEDTPINGRLIAFGVVVVLLILAWLWLNFTSSRNDNNSGAAAVINEASVTLTATATQNLPATMAASELSPTPIGSVTSVIPTEIGTAAPTNTATPTVTLTPSPTFTAGPTFTPTPAIEASATPEATPTDAIAPSATVGVTATSATTMEPSTMLTVTLEPAPSLQPITTETNSNSTSFAIASPVNGEELPPGDMIISGIAPPNERVQVLDNDQVIAAITVNAQGQWRYTYSPAPGLHRLQVRPIDQPERTSPVIEVTVRQPIVQPSAGCTQGQVSGNRYIVGTCETLADISETTNTDLLELVETNPDINPNLIYPGQVITLPD